MMDIQILEFLTRAVTACLSWFSQIFESIGGIKILYFVMFFVVLTFRFLINPFMGSSVGSDTASGSRPVHDSSVKMHSVDD